MIDLTIKHGYYFLINKKDEEQIFEVEIGKAYQKDGVKNFAVKVENGFMNYYSNGVKQSIRDVDVVNTFESVAQAFIDTLVEHYTPGALLKRSGDNLISFFQKENSDV